MLPNTPTLKVLRSRIAKELEQKHQQQGVEIDVKTPGLGYAEIVNVLSGVAHGLWGGLNYIADQQLVKTMADDTVVAAAGEYGLTRVLAGYSQGMVTVISTDIATVSAGTFLTSSEGYRYKTLADFTFSGVGSTELSVVAVTSGILSDLPVGGVLTFETPIQNINSEASISTGIIGGTSLESIERLGDRLLLRKQAPPKGGSREDYKTWAKEAHADVTRAWVFEHENGVGSVVVRVVTEGLENPIPGAAVISDIYDYISDLRPAGLRAFSVEALTPVPLNLQFTKLTPNTPEVQAAVELEITDFLHKEAAPDQLAYISHIREAISRAVGERDFAITLNADVTLSTSEYLVLGTTIFP